MANIFFVSDTHFGHKNILTFKRGHDGAPMREFASVEEMDEFIVQRWNETVKPSDKVYHLGDVAMKKACVETVGRCHGHKRLVRGNHDIEDTKLYLKYFEAIYGTRVFEDRDIILSHIPIHPESLRDNWTNVHGHVHNNVLPLHFGVRYLNISIEVTDYRPLSIEEVQQRIRAQKDENQRLVEANLARLGVKRLWTDEELRSERPRKQVDMLPVVSTSV